VAILATINATAKTADAINIIVFLFIILRYLNRPTLRFACVGLIALRAFCLSEAAQGIIF
jgi:hypothetical protein